MLIALFFAGTFQVRAQNTIAVAKDNFTYFTPDNTYPDKDKLMAITPPAYLNHPDFGKCFTTNAQWYEQIAKRTLKTRSYIDEKGEVITQYGYDNLNYADNNGWLVAVDTRLKPSANGWAVTQQENPAYLYSDASTALSIGNGQVLTFNKNVQFNSVNINTEKYSVGDNGMIINDVVANTDKIIRFKRNTVETDYLINKPLNLTNDLIISEDIILPAGYSITQSNISNDFQAEEGSLFVIGPDGKEKAILKVPACYDNGKNEVLGSYIIQKQAGGYRLEIKVPSSWLNAPTRRYPVTIDPLVTGTTSQWSGGKIASCIYPNFGSGTITVTIPADITIIAFYVQSSFYANSLVSEPLKDGLVYFSTTCGSTGLYTVNPPKGDSSGTGTIPLTDFHSSLSCCVHPSCSQQTIALTMNLSRSAGGNSCDSQYIYYDPANTGGSPFEAYVVGNTVEENNSNWSVSPAGLCSNNCTLVLNATIQYGVPPYTISHPWADSSMTVGLYDSTICSSVGNAKITLSIPNCPASACDTTFLNVPPPIITDACGTSVQGLSFKKDTIFPAPKVIAFPDSQTICSGAPFNISLSSCLAGTTFTWTGSDGSKGAGSPIIDSIADTGTTVKKVSYIIIPSTGRCTGIPDTVYVNVVPVPKSTFSVNPSKICLNDTVIVTYTGDTISGANYNWNFGGGTIFSGSGVGPYKILYSSTGPDSISLIVSANGCTSVRTVAKVNINALPVIKVTPSPTTICAGSSVELIASGANSYAWVPALGLSTTNLDSTLASPTITTVYTVAGTDSNGCVGTITDTVNVNAKPIITLSALPIIICTDSSTVITASGAKTYLWSPSIGLSATTGSSVTANPTVTTKYTVLGTDSLGCSDTSSITIVVNPKLVITISPLNPRVCIGTPTTLTASGATYYVWSPVTGLSSSTGSSVMANTTITATYTVTGTDTIGCFAIDTFILKVDTVPILKVAPSPATICAGVPTELTASGAVNYSWLPTTGLNIANQASVMAGPTITTIYTISGTDSNGCTGNITDTINVNPLPIITAKGIPAKVCADSSAVLTAQGGKTYTWLPSTGLSATTGSMVIATPTITTKYTVTGTDTLGCSDTATVTVIVNPKIPVNVTPVNPKICEGFSITLTASGGTTYSWSPSTGLNSYSGTSVIGNPTVTTTYTVSSIDTLGCYEATTITLTVDTNPKVSVSPNPAIVCYGTSTLLTAVGSTNYTWSPKTGLSSTTGSTVSANPTQPVTYTIVGTNTTGCTDTITVNALIKELPHISVAPLTSKFCFGDSINLSGYGGSTYTWSPALGLRETAGSTVTAVPPFTTTYTVTGTDTNGCSDTASSVVQIIPAPVVTVSPSNPEFCIGGSLTVLASGGLSYIWTPASGLSCTNCSNPVVNVTTTSTYIIQATDAATCVGYDTLTIKVDTIPSLSISKDTTVCEDKPVQLSATSSGTVTWAPSTGLSCTTCNNPTATTDSTTNYIATATNGTCSFNDTTTITINVLKLIVDSNRHIVYSKSAQLSVSGGIHYVWTPAASLNNDTISDPIATPTITTTYYVTGTDIYGCSSTDSIVVYVSDPCQAIMVPSGFSPNGDGKNDYLHVLNVGVATLQEFRVYNRWGEMVYQTSDINDRGWDGTLNGKPQPVGTYVYYVEATCEGKSISLKGNVILLR